MDAISPECITHVRYLGTGRYHTSAEVVNTAPYLLCVRKVNLLSPEQKAILDATGCANKGRDNSAFSGKGSGNTNRLRYKCEMCDNWTDYGDCPYAAKCDFFHKGPDDNLPWWPHEAKLDFWLTRQGEDASPAVISDDEEAPPGVKVERHPEDVVMGDDNLGVNLVPDHDVLAASSGAPAAGTAASSSSGQPTRSGGADNRAGSGDPPARRPRRSRSASNKVPEGRSRRVNLSDSGSDQEPTSLV